MFDAVKCLYPLDARYLHEKTREHGLWVAWNVEYRCSWNPKSVVTLERKGAQSASVTERAGDDKRLCCLTICICSNGQ
jgi:hypothetical protein